MKKLFIIFIFISSVCHSGEMYKWTDKNGVVRFTNTAPPADAQKIGKETAYTAQPITQENDKPDYMKYDKPAKTTALKSNVTETDKSQKSEINSHDKNLREYPSNDPYKVVRQFFGPGAIPHRTE